jgi:hypothetical protein
MHDDEELYTEDLTSRVFIYIATSYPDEPDCSSVVRSEPPPVPTPSASPTFGPADDLAGVDPCTLVPPSVDALLDPEIRRETRESWLSLGTPANACHLVVGAPLTPTVTHVAVTLFPRSVDATDATALAQATLGGGLAEEAVGDALTWANDCSAQELDCPAMFVVWSAPRVVVVQFPAEFPASPSVVSHASARAVAVEIAGALGGEAAR